MELLKHPSVSFPDLQKALCDGANFPNTKSVTELRDKVEAKLMGGQRWEERAQGVLNSRPRPTLSHLQKLLKEADKLGIVLPSAPALKNTILRASDWCRILSDIKLDQSKGRYTSLKQLEAVLLKGKQDFYSCLMI